jgi:hypothetical protein
MLFDGHPDVKDHLNFFNNNIKDRFEFTLEKNESVILKVHDSIAKKLEALPSHGKEDRPGVQEIIFKECKIIDSNFPYKPQGLL